MFSSTPLAAGSFDLTHPIADFMLSRKPQPYSNFEVRRMVGGGFLDSMKSAMGWVKSKLPAVRGVLENIPNEYAQTGANVLRTMGYGKNKQLESRLM